MAPANPQSSRAVVGVGVGVGAWLRQGATSPFAPVALLLAWSLLALAATQLPQADAPLPVADGLSRADHLSLAALGLHRLGDSALFALLAGLSVLVFVARGLFPLDTAIWTAPLANRSATEAALRQHLPALQLVRQGEVTIGSLGWPRLASAALLLGAAAALAFVALRAGQALPIWVDVPLGAAEAPLEAWRADAGRLAPAPGRWRGNCQRTPTGGAIAPLRCSLERPGGRDSWTLLPGQAISLGEHRLAWVATGRAATPQAFEVRWQPPGARTPSAIQLTSGEARDAATLHTRWLPTTTRGAGPLVIGVERERTFGLVSPVLAPGQPALATAIGPEVVRLQLTPLAPWWLLWSALLLAASGAALAWLRPAVRLHLDAADTLHLLSCNRLAVLQQIKAASLGRLAAFAPETVAQTRDVQP